MFTGKLIVIAILEDLHLRSKRPVKCPNPKYSIVLRKDMIYTENNC